MDDDIYIYMVNLPPGVHEAVLSCLTGYTIYLNENDEPERRFKAYQHALCHIRNNDFAKLNVQEVESSAHSQNTGG